MKELCLKFGIVVLSISEPRQMVLGTDNQEKGPPLEGSPPMAPKLPVAPSLYPILPPYLEVPPPQKPTQICPLVGTGGEFGPTRVHKSFSLLELRSYADNPGKYIDTFQHITLVFDLTWKDIMVIFSQTLSDPEHDRVLKEVQRYATGLHMSPSHITFTDDKYAVGETAVPS